MRRLRGVLDGLAAAAVASGADDVAIGAALRVAKGQVALLAAAAETGGAWTHGAIDGGALRSGRCGARRGARRVAPARRSSKGDSPRPTRRDCGLTLFALGKHGGRELNYSSDIDIVAFFDPRGGRAARPDEATKLYPRIVQRLAALMQDRRRRRLRVPHRPAAAGLIPGSTPMALSTDAALAYYESRGQNWERAAWIKARPCAGDKAAGEAFLAELAPYIWRRHLDFATIADIQAMKRQINIAKNVGEARVEGHNVKLGRGGIREIEFFAQTQQLIAGGRDKSLRVRPTAMALAALAGAGWIAEKTAAELTRDLLVPARRREPAADAARRADARHAGRRPRASRSSRG